MKIHLNFIYTHKWNWKFLIGKNISEWGLLKCLIRLICFIKISNQMHAEMLWGMSGFGNSLLETCLHFDLEII